MIMTTTGAAAPVDELVEIIAGEKKIETMQNEFIAMINQTNPGMTPHLPILQKWSKTYVTWDSLKSEFSKIYSDHFDQEEIKALLAFYKTPIGKKSIELRHTLNAQSAQAGQNLALKHQEELKNMLKNSTERK